jgi:hypothetical protein
MAVARPEDRAGHYPVSDDVGRPPPDGHRHARWHEAPVSQDIREVLKPQGEALLRGDQQGWLASIDPKVQSAVARYQQCFKVLLALHATGWEVEVELPPRRASWAPGTEPLPITVGHRRPQRCKFRALDPTATGN